jgi:hypothetical protein
MNFRILKEDVEQNSHFLGYTMFKPSFKAKLAWSFPLSFSHCVHNVQIF